MRRFLVLGAAIAFVICLATAPMAAYAAVAPSNADCVGPGCHGAPATAAPEGFHLPAVDQSKCNNCHWVYKHSFDWYHDGYLQNYMSLDCAQCHAEDLGFPPRPLPWLGSPETSTSFGHFQSLASLDATPGQLHKIHGSGSWEQGQSGCVSCHGPAACDACHAVPAQMHVEHLNLGVQAIPTTVLIGRVYGHDCPDTYLYQTNPTTNFGGGSTFYVGKTSSGEERALLHFPIASIPETFTSAQLVLTRSMTGTTTVRVYRLRRTDWVAAQATWNVYRTGASWTASGAGDPATDYYSGEYSESASSTIDVTGLLRAAASNGDTAFDILLKDPAPVLRKYTGFYSAESVNPASSPVLRIAGSNMDTAYASPPISYTVALGTAIGDESAGVTRTGQSTCISVGCHELAKAATSAFKPQCAACHPFADITASHNPPHEPSGMDTNCLSCHLDNVLTEHLGNPTTHSSELSCKVCHDSGKSNFEWAVELQDKTCSQCHTGAHALGLSPTPVGLPLYPLSRWSPVVDSTLFAGETWLPSVFSGQGELIFSDRRTDVSVADAWAFYRDQLGANGWTLTSPAPAPGATSFSGTWAKGHHTVIVLYFNSSIPGGTDAVSSGYRFEVLYQ